MEGWDSPGPEHAPSTVDDATFCRSRRSRASDPQAAATGGPRRQRQDPVGGSDGRDVIAIESTRLQVGLPKPAL